MLGVAAIVSSIARPPERGGDDSDDRVAPAKQQQSASATKQGNRTPQPVTVEFSAGAKPQTRAIEVGQPATVLVDVQTPGQIDIPSLGLTDAAEPLTPALFEVLVTAKGKHAIMVQPATSDALPSKLGTLKVVPAS